MKGKKVVKGRKKSSNLESVKIERKFVEMVRNNKTVTGVSIRVFIEQAIDEKLNK